MPLYKAEQLEAPFDGVFEATCPEEAERMSMRFCGMFLRNIDIDNTFRSKCARVLAKRRCPMVPYIPEPSLRVYVDLSKRRSNPPA